MKLRAKLSLTLCGAAAVLIAGVQWLRIGLEEREAVNGLADFARWRMESGGRTQCEAAPATFRDPPNEMLRWLPPEGGPFPPPPPPGAGWLGPMPGDGVGQPFRGPRIEMFAYGPDFISANPSAPAFPEDLRKGLESGVRQRGSILDVGGRHDVQVGVRMNWSEGPCAVVLAWRHGYESATGPLAGIAYSILIVGGLLIAALLVTSPFVKRVGRLAEAVRSAPAGHYRGSVAVGGKDEIAELGRAFEAAAAEVRARIAEVEQREQTLRVFVENTTHDVMLPLTVLQGHLSDLRDALYAASEGERGLVIGGIEESHYLASLLQNLGVAASLEAGRPQPRRDQVSWPSLIERVVQRHAPIARGKGVLLDVALPGEDVRVLGDLTLLEQALSNIVHNAVRYNEEGGHVAVILEADASRFLVRVIDDGPGVSASDMAKLSERAYRGDGARARYPDGKGLGLAIARQVADQHGFELKLAHPEAGGLQVELSGPVAPR